MNEIFRRYMKMMKRSHGYTYEYFDYLEHTGHGEYIELPYQPNNRTRMKFRYSVPTNTEECILFGSRNSSRTSVLYWYQNTNSGSGIFSRTGGGPTNFGNTIVYDWYEVEALTPSSWVRRRPGTSTVDQTRNWDATEFTIPFNMYLFATNHNDAPIGTTSSNSSVNKIAGVKMSAIELREDSMLLMNLKPARRSDGRTGYHDVLNDVFYFSETEHNFNVGNYADEYVYYDYIGSDSSQYINTGIYPNQDTRVVCMGKVRSRNRFFMFGARNNNNDASFLVRLTNGSSTTADYNTLGNQSLGEVTIGDWYTIDANKNVWSRTDKEGNVTTFTFPSQTFQNNGKMLLFGLLQSYNNKVYADAGDISYCYIYDNGLLVRDYKPAVRRWDGKVGMFERVNNILYQSYTSTAFATYGNWS